MSLTETEIQERLTDLYEHRLSLRQREKLDSNAATIQYYEKLLKSVQSKDPKRLKSETSFLKNQIEINFVNNLSPVPPVVDRKSMRNSFTQRPKNLSMDLRDIVYVDSDGEDSDHPSPNHLYYKSNGVYPEFLKPEKWGSAYSLLADVTSQIHSKIFPKHVNPISDHSQPKYLDLTKPVPTAPPIVDEIPRKTEDYVDVKADELLKELNSTTEEEEDISEDTDRQIEELEKSIGAETTAEQDLLEMEQQMLQEKLENQITVFEIQTTPWIAEFDLLRKSFVEAVSNVRKWKTENSVDKNDKVISQEKTSNGIVIMMESGKKVIYTPITQESKITFPDGKIIHKWRNGNYKLILPKDKIITFTQATGLYHVINGKLSENWSYAFYYLKSGACVKMYKDTSKIQVLHTGDRILIKDGSKEIIFGNGMKEKIHANGIKEIILANGKRVLKK
jgi:hypothetical protein